MRETLIKIYGKKRLGRRGGLRWGGSWRLHLSKCSGFSANWCSEGDLNRRVRRNPHLLKRGGDEDRPDNLRKDGEEGPAMDDWKI